MVFRIPQSVIKIGYKGGERSSGWKLEGLTQALDRYLFHKEKDNWDYPQEYYTNNCLDIEV